MAGLLPKDYESVGGAATWASIWYAHLAFGHAKLGELDKAQNYLNKHDDVMLWLAVRSHNKLARAEGRLGDIMEIPERMSHAVRTNKGGTETTFGA